MTIKKGEPWGESATLPADAIVARGDREVSLALEDARRRGVSFPSFGLIGGDLCHTLGGRDDEHRLRVGATRFSIDVGELLADGVHHFFVAHVVSHSFAWRNFFVAMNAQWFGDWNFGPKGHPNDGVLDVSEGDLGFGQWRQVKKRLPSGTHLPHPGIATSRVRAADAQFTKARPLFVDGQEMTPATVLAVRVIPDAIQVIA